MNSWLSSPLHFHGLRIGAEQGPPFFFLLKFVQYGFLSRNQRIFLINKQVETSMFRLPWSLRRLLVIESEVIQGSRNPTSYGIKKLLQEGERAQWWE